MARKLDDWLTSYVEYASMAEAPQHVNTWIGIGTLGAALRRKVWLDFPDYSWYPNLFIIVVAPPGLGKTTTMGKAMKILKEVEGINFAPDIITWQKLARNFADYRCDFTYEGKTVPMSAVMIASSEMSDLLNFDNKEMISFYTSIWEGRPVNIETKTAGNDSIVDPAVTLIGCTNMDWVSNNITLANIGGGFASRCIFIQYKKKDKRIAYVPPPTKHQIELRSLLVQDLREIAKMTGPMTMTPEAIKFGEIFYDDLCNAQEAETDQAFHGYLTRKQTQTHKVAMALSASRGDSRVIELHDLQLAYTMMGDTESGFKSIFSKIGRSDDSKYANHVLDMIKKEKFVKAERVFQYAHYAFPKLRDFNEIIAGLQGIGAIHSEQLGNDLWFRYIGEL